jgi:hypothetical protein
VSHSVHTYTVACRAARVLAEMALMSRSGAVAKPLDGRLRRRSVADPRA